MRRYALRDGQEDRIKEFFLVAKAMWQAGPGG
jgi:hypothetical protein